MSQGLSSWNNCELLSELGPHWRSAALLSGRGRQAMFRAQRALLDARLAEGERLVEAAHRLGQQVQPRVSQIYYTPQLFLIRREQRRVPELMPLFMQILDQYPGMPIVRCFPAPAAAA
jgi:hypothetical protein